ncbi:MAG: hypothetical protein MZV63_58765 [Marinilabiliales bacterium]|nr:hypothetical protein [Marinilabiliales bacterium]
MAIAAGADLTLGVGAADAAAVAGLAVVEARPGRRRIVPDETPHVRVVLVADVGPRRHGLLAGPGGQPPAEAEDERSKKDRSRRLERVLHGFSPKGGIVP